MNERSATFALTLSDATMAKCNDMREFSTKLKRETNYMLTTMVIIGDWHYPNFLKTLVRNESELRSNIVTVILITN